jgi:hypothetical protein
LREVHENVVIELPLGEAAKSQLTMALTRYITSVQEDKE